ncbi:primosomal protein DnaI [Gemella sp. GH3]|uniref:primosomal protein DnaI n=1 Tax=unclassified Gemella TaxID=2624949 RepID=UPI0015D0A6E2|nr:MULTISPECIES: primosomal protein DnaI [unclassified Gemella]MBF0714164.1 primosomal protein DnaI [Gemella sp. GH3.1]NYS51116.1 primosomal protein DnaI [Gemella sp. GH3]
MKKVTDLTSKISIKKNDIQDMFENVILKDKTVINFINKYNLSYDDVNNNTQVFYEYYLSKKNKKSILYNPKLQYKDGKVYLIYNETAEQKRNREARKLSNRIKTAYISKSILYSNFSNVNNTGNKVAVATKLISICDNILANKGVQGLYVYGMTGIGKSYLMGCVYNYLNNKGLEPAIVYFPEFVRKMKSSIYNNEYNYIIDELRQQKVLIIDDIGAENITEFVRDEILVPIINYRSSEKLVTFFTSNLSLRNLSDVLAVTKNTIDETKSMRIIGRISHLAKEEFLDAKNERGSY